MLDLSFFGLVLLSVFIIIDPFANIPIASALLEKFPSGVRKSIIQKSHIVAFVLFIIFSLFGQLIFDYLGIRLFAFKIAGGILLALIGVEMLYRIKSQTEYSSGEQAEAEAKENLAITPLAIPFITGPGAMITGILLFSQTHGDWFLLVEFILAAISAYSLSYLLFRQSDRVRDLVGSIGLKVFTRVMGLLLLSMAIQLILTGLHESGIALSAL